jgi:hypothetical protein
LPDALTTGEVGFLFLVDASTVRDWIEAGALPAYRMALDNDDDRHDFQFMVQLEDVYALAQERKPR